MKSLLSCLRKGGNMKIILLYANGYSMADEKTGVINEGISVNYLCTDKLTPNPVSKNTAGYKPARGSLPVTARSSIVSVPGIYEADTDISIDRDGKPVIKLKDVTFISDIAAPASSASKK